MSTFVVVTIFEPADGKAPIVHAWGPYTSRTAATSAKRRMQLQDARRLEDERRPGKLTWRVREVLGEEPPR